jgi:hypothetical protein
MGRFKVFYVLLVVGLSGSLGCTATPEFHTDVQIGVQQGRPTILAAKNIQYTPENITKKKGPALIQLGLWKGDVQASRPDMLFPIPDLYLNEQGTFSFTIQSDFKVTAVTLHEMDGSSGHFTLKNTTPLQIFDLSP